VTTGNRLLSLSAALTVVELQRFCFGQGDGSGVPRTVWCVACSIQADDARLPLGVGHEKSPRSGLH